ncbi:MAG: galactokinase, partial [Gemmatimonadetes bacterium]|nr:galactokinase [Gemmatimonadota bacterium]
FASDLPQAAGLSSSSALVVAVFLAVDAVRGISATPEYTAAIRDNADLAGYLGAVENGMSYRTLAGASGVGTMGGSEDHTAILCARAGSLMQFSYAPVRYENDVRMPAGWTFAVGATGVRAEKAGTDLQHYNNLAAAVRQLVRCWHDTEAGDEDTLAGVLGSSPDAALRLREIVRQRAGGEADGLMARLAQFIAESEEIVPAARAALARGDVTAFSTLARRSQHYAEHVLGNQVPETIQLVASAHELGAAAASAFGAGFGGSVWALVREDEAEVFLNAWKVDYHARFAHRQAESAFFITPAAAPATRLEEVIA